MRILVGYSHYPYEVDIGQWNESWLSHLRAQGILADGICLTINPPGPCFLWRELDERWRRRDKTLLNFYESLIKKLENYDIFVNYNGINIHPDFVQQLPTFNVFGCFDDPESSDHLSRPVAWAYDLCMVGNIAALDLYRSWGAKAVGFLPIGFRADDYNPALSRDQILHATRDVDITLLCERTSAWRRERLDRFVAAFPHGAYFGPGWPKGFLPEAQRVPLLQRTKIGINIHNSTGPINFRTYYLPANGVMQICDNKAHLAKLFELGKEVAGYDTIEEAIDLCRYYLAHDEERRQIAAAGWERTLRDYNEVAAFRRIITAVEELRSGSVALQLKSGSIPHIHTPLINNPPSSSNLKAAPTSHHTAPRIIPLDSEASSIESYLENAQWFPADIIQDIQLQRLKQLLAHAYANVPFYHERLRQVGLEPDDINSLEALKKIPILTKSDIQQHLPELVAKNFDASKLLRDATGGSTGRPISFYRDTRAQGWLDFAAKRFRRWIGYLPESKLALIWGADRDVPSIYPPNQRWLNSFDFSSEKIAAFIQDLLTWRPVAIRGYASSLYLVASHLKAHGFSPPHPLAQGIESAAEKIWDWQRPLIEEIFGCKVFNMYGSREIPSIGCECEHHAGLHLFADIRLVEVIAHGRTAQPGEAGSIIITDLVNYGMPLIRYEIGDIGVLAERNCPCGRGFPLLADIKGRITSTITTPDGRYIHGEYFTHLFYNQPGVAAFQVRQKVLEEIEVLVQPSAGFDPQQIIQLVSQIQAHLGPKMSVRWKQVAAIPPAPSGKYHFTISDIPTDYLHSKAVHPCPSPTPRSSRKRLNVIYDVSVLVEGDLDPRSRTGVFRASAQIARALQKLSQCDIRFVTRYQNPNLAPIIYQDLEVPAGQLYPLTPEILQGVDIFHTPWHPIPLPLTQLHSLLPFIMIHDLIAIEHPEFFNHSLVVYVEQLLQSIQGNAHVICNSHYTKQSLLHHYRISAERVFVTHLAADTNLFYPCTTPYRLQSVRDRYQIGSGPYILSVCTLEPRKNLAQVVNSFCQLAQSEPIDDLKLVLVGAAGWKLDELMKNLKVPDSLKNRIVVTGYVDDEELAPLYSGALCFIYLSLMEGFGLPPLEAMQCGTPVITSNTSSLPEVVGDSGVMLTPDDTDGLCQWVLRFYQQPALRQTYAHQSIGQAKTFNWERCAQETIDAYYQAIAQ